MKCPKCKKNNANDALFCEFCGTKLSSQNKQQSLNDNQNIIIVNNKKKLKKGKSKKDRKKVYIIGAIAIVLAIIATAIAIFFAMQNATEKRYNDKIAQAQKYVEVLDYNKAEDAYLEAIEIDPKLPQAYVEVSDVYVVQQKTDQAIDILETAKDDVADEYIEVIENKIAEVNQKITNIDFMNDMYEAFNDEDFDELYSLSQDFFETSILDEIKDDKPYIFFPKGDNKEKGLGIYLFKEDKDDEIKLKNIYFYYGTYEKEKRNGEFKAFNNAEVYDNNDNFVDYDGHYYTLTIEDDKVNGAVEKIGYSLNSNTKFIYHENYVDGYLDGDFTIDAYSGNIYNTTCSGSATKGIYNEITDEYSLSIINNSNDKYIIAKGDQMVIYIEYTTSKDDLDLEYLP